MCKTFRKFPDDPEIENMDPLTKAYMFFQWLEDYEDEQKLLENQAYLIGSFINPELVKKILGKDSETIESTDEEFEAFSKRLLENNRKEEQKQVRRKKRKRKIQG